MIEQSFFRLLLQQANTNMSRSTVLQPLWVFFSICILAIFGSIFFQGPLWILYLFGCTAGLTVILYLSTYIYCLFKDRDALRSEKYSIQKLAIEKGLFGDDKSGLLKITFEEAENLITQEAQPQKGDLK